MDPALIIAIGAFLLLSFTTAVLILFACALSARISRAEDDERVNAWVEDDREPAYHAPGRVARRPA
jgi:hypothetical protein